MHLRAPYVAPTNAVDKMHPAVHHKQGALGWGLFLDEPVTAEAVVLRSPVLLAANGTDPCSEALVLREHILSNGLLDSSSPSFSFYLYQCCALLYPRQGTNLLAKLTMNQMGVIGTYTSSLYGLSSFFNHSCAPNCGLRQDDLLRERLFYALHDLPRGELCISYIVYPIDNRAVRAKLLSGLGFQCACECCASDTPPSLRRYTHETHHCWECARPAHDLYRCRCNATYCSARCRITNSATHSKICTK